MKLGEIISYSIRLLQIARRPKPHEFRKIAKVAGIGALLIGLIGILVSAIASYL